MYSKYVECTKDDLEKIEWLGGDFNAAPPNLKEVTEEHVVVNTYFLTYSPTARTFRQIRLDGEPYLSMTLLIYHDRSGVGLVRDYWQKRVRWFTFGCDHKYKEISRPAGHRSGLHTDECTICGYKNTYDTSD